MQPRQSKRVASRFIIILLSIAITFGNTGFVRAAGNTKVYYYLYDHLGGVDKMTDEEGNVVCSNDYLPFGDLRRGDCTDNDEDYGFTGKEKDPETGLMYYGARFYDATLGRFISPDPWGGDLLNPQTLNKYSYALNNPLKFIDPTGEKIELVARPVLNFLGLLGAMHTFLRITPDNPDDFQGVTQFTVGAYGEKRDGEIKLVKAINHPNETVLPSALEQKVTINPPEGKTDTEFINAAMDTYSRYGDNRKWTASGTQNSCDNSANCSNFTTGMLEGAGVAPEVIDSIDPTGVNWGLGTPIPEMSDQSRTNRAQWQQEFNQKTASPPKSFGEKVRAKLSGLKDKARSFFKKDKE